MARQGQEISNPRTGQWMKFVKLTPEELLIESVNPPSAVREPIHTHPRQESGTEVISGALVFEVAGERRPLGVGETITVPAGTLHRFWNEGPGEARSIQFFRPALETAAFFETLFALAQRGQLDEQGMPKLLPLAALAGEFADEIRPATPPWPLIRALTVTLRPVARLRGYRGRLTLPA